MLLHSFSNLQKGIFLKRYKRFLMDILVEGKTITIHCANTGSMKTCLQENASVFYSTSSHRKRKYPYSLELMLLEDGLACLNTMVANSFIKKMLIYRKTLNCALLEDDFSKGNIIPEKSIPHKNTRFDFLFENENEKKYIEVKSVSLKIENGYAFPDAVTLRGQKHLQEMILLQKEGHSCYLFFLLMRGEENFIFRAAYEYDPHYATLLEEALKQGVQVRLIKPKISLEGLSFHTYKPFTL